MREFAGKSHISKAPGVHPLRRKTAKAVTSDNPADGKKFRSATATLTEEQNTKIQLRRQEFRNSGSELDFVTPRQPFASA
jgi:hypothetical protein